MNDLADYLGAKYGGWHELALLYSRRWGTKEWLAIPMGGSGGASVYRVSWLKEAGYDSIPNDHAGFLAMCEKLNKINHPVGFALGHAVGDGNGFADWLLWSHGAALTDRGGQGLAGFERDDRRAELCQGTVSADDRRHLVLGRSPATTRPSPPATSA